MIDRWLEKSQALLLVGAILVVFVQLRAQLTTGEVAQRTIINGEKISQLENQIHDLGTLRISVARIEVEILEQKARVEEVREAQNLTRNISLGELFALLATGSGLYVKQRRQSHHPHSHLKEG